MSIVTLTDGLPAILARIRALEADHAPDGWPEVQMRDLTAMRDEIMHLLAALEQAWSALDDLKAQPQPETVRIALSVAKGALGMCKPCAEPDCKAEQQEWIDEAIEAIERAEAQPQPKEQPAAWQPIETAPKRTKLLLAYRNQLGKWRRVQGEYWPSEELESDHSESGFADEGWYEATEAYEEMAPLEHDPTHWMPLPEPPVLAAQAKGAK